MSLKVYVATKIVLSFFLLYVDSFYSNLERNKSLDIHEGLFAENHSKQKIALH